MLILHLFQSCCSEDAIHRASTQCVVQHNAYDSHTGHDHDDDDADADDDAVDAFEQWGSDSSDEGETDLQAPEAKSSALSANSKGDHSGPSNDGPISGTKSLVAGDVQLVSNQVQAQAPDAKDSAISTNTKCHNSDPSDASHEKSKESPQANSLQSKSGRDQKRSGLKASQGFSHEASFSESCRSIKASHAASNISGISSKIEECALITAVKLEDVEEVRREIRDRPETVNYPDRFRQTPIFWTVRHGNMEILRLLVGARACVQGVANKFGYTPLMRAMHWGQIEVGKFLLSHRSDLCALDKFKGSCLQVAATAGNVQAVSWLLRKEGAKPLITNADEVGRTPLLCASRNGHSGVCRLLLQAAARPDVRDHNGRTPLLFSLARNDVDSVSQLISHHADVNARDKAGQPLLIILVNNLLQFREQETLCGIVSILEAKAMVDERDRNRSTALMLAADKNHPMLCTVLAAHGAKAANLHGSALTRGFFDVAAALEGISATLEHKYTGKNDSNPVQTCLQDLHSVSHLYGQIQVALQHQDASLAVEKLVLVQSVELSVKVEAEWTRQFQNLLLVLRNSVMSSSFKMLRALRLRERESCLNSFTKSLQKWHDKDKLDPRGLQVLIGVGVSNVTACKQSLIELSDPHTKKVEHAQASLIESTMLKLIDIHAMVNEELQALEAFPDPNYKVEIARLQCGKCMEMFASNIILKDHSRYCTSKLRAETERDLKENQRERADIALYRLADAEKTFRNRMNALADILDRVEHAQIVCKRRTPEALIPLRACAGLLEMVVQLLDKRLSRCNKAAEDASKQWFPNGSRESQSAVFKACAVCLVERATLIGVHREKFDNCYGASCIQCACILTSKLQREEVPCPVCRKPLLRLDKA
mmetsp:Transcript_50532/g.94411  ORF Transcript_50532/g.94411 Transcript_50532/m.94411 type:complete len:882 (+) Transcript_50532:77-2722(+)